MAESSGPILAPDLVPGPAIIQGAIAWDPTYDTAPALTHAITVALHAPHAPDAGPDGTRSAAQLQLHSIRLDVASWRELASREFTFPHVVKEIHEDGDTFTILDIYGTVEVGGEFHEAMPSRIRFGMAHGLTIPVEIMGDVRRGLGVAAAPPEPLHIEAVLDVRPVQVVGEVDATGTYPGIAEAEDLANRLLRRSDYEEAVVVDGCVSFAPRPANTEPSL